MAWTTWPIYIQRRYALSKVQATKSLSSSSADLDDESILPKDAVDWIYGVLTTLDAKASALMRLNGVLIAAAAFMLGLFGRQGGTILSTQHLDAMAIVMSALLSAVSIVLCLFVVNVSWPFLGKVKISEKKFEFGSEIDSLGRALVFRQCAYRSAWYISLFASLGFIGEYAWQAAYVICKGQWSC